MKIKCCQLFRTRFQIVVAIFALSQVQAAVGQELGPAAPHPVCGVDCANGCICGKKSWRDSQPIPWQQYGQGEYIGHYRAPHVPEYRLRVDDLLEFVYRVTREKTPTPYELNVGDQIQVESFADERINRTLIIQPDGSITLSLLGQVPAAGKTVDQLRRALDELYKKYYNQPAITVIPVQVNTKLEDLRATINGRQGFNGQSFQSRVAPDGTVTLPAVGNVPVQGLTLSELRRELAERYAMEIEGIEVMPTLSQKAPRFVYVLGEVPNPGRFTIDQPTTVMQALAMAGGWNVGANLKQVVIFRRGDDWRLLATMIDIRGALFAKQPCPADELWLSDSDIIVVPKSKILQFDDWVSLVFTRGFYGFLPGQSTAISFTHSGRL
jgi:polysaccharide export outer membrane protein